MIGVLHLDGGCENQKENGKSSGQALDSLPCLIWAISDSLVDVALLYILHRRGNFQRARCMHAHVISVLYSTYMHLQAPLPQSPCRICNHSPPSPSLRHHPPSMPAPEIPFSTFCKSESHSDTNTSHQSYAQHRRAPFIVITHRFSLFDSVDTPEEYDHRIEQGNDRGDSESDCGRQGDVVAEIEKGCSNGAEDDGKFEL